VHKEEPIIVAEPQSISDGSGSEMEKRCGSGSGSYPLAYKVQNGSLQ
jgi:hypothetical protein